MSIQLERTPTTGWTDPLVPPWRLGELLCQARVHKGLTLADVEDVSGGDFTMSELAGVERGTRTLADHRIERLCALYGLHVGRVVPARVRLELDPSARNLRFAGHELQLRGSDAHQEVLSRYLSLVYSMRRIQPGTRLPLRIDDLDVLGRALECPVGRVRADLEGLMVEMDGPVRDRFSQLRARFTIPAVGVLVACTALGALVLVNRERMAPAASDRSRPTLLSSTPGAGSVPEAPGAEVDASVKVVGDGTGVGTAAVLERNADGTIGPVRAR